MGVNWDYPLPPTGSINDLKQICSQNDIFRIRQEMNEIQVNSGVDGNINLPIKVDDCVGIRPIYLWKQDRTIRPSRREQVVLDGYLKNFDFREAGRALKGHMVKRVLSEANWTKLANRWLQRDHLKEYVGQVLRDRGIAGSWTEERWIAVAHDDITGKETLTPGGRYMMSLIAKVRNWNASVGGMNQITQINFTERE